MAYLLDANVFISAKNNHYGMDFCPAFWEWIRREHVAGRVFSVGRVRDEIEAGEDELVDWVASMSESFFVHPDASTLSALGVVSTWVTEQPNYSAAAKHNFLQIADYYLVAQALAGGHTVVTHERPANAIHTVKIPNVCLGVGVKCVNPYEMLRHERARFVLATP